MKNALSPVKIIPDDFAINLSDAIDFKGRIAAANGSEWTQIFVGCYGPGTIERVATGVQGRPPGA
jgi:hypothetical protein